ncbi:MAG TPA: hypothetical protein VK348_02075 [Planctomycetota bacterium]|nr:hypothetical protein [Planctomycetota bacterium]
MTTKFEMHKDEAQRFYFSLTATDGTELLRSLPYFSKSHARRDATHVPPMLKDEQHLHRHEMHGKYYFVLKNDRGEMFARSLHVGSPLALDEIITEAREAAEKALLLDHTTGSRPSVSTF